MTDFEIAALRYFNAVFPHRNVQLGETLTQPRNMDDWSFKWDAGAEDIDMHIRELNEFWRSATAAGDVLTAPEKQP